MKLEEVKTFLEYVNKKGIMSGNTVNSLSGAIIAVNDALDPEERMVDFVLANGDVIKNRLQNKSTDMSGKTINEYVVRTQRALKHFIEWKKDRAGWEKNQASKPKVEASSAKKDKKASQQTASDTTGQQKTTLNGRTIPVPTNNGLFEVAIPEKFVMSDLVRVVWALAVHAKDFDPSDVLQRFGKPPAQTYEDQSTQEMLVSKNN